MTTTISADDLLGLRKDDHVIGEPMFPGLDDEPIKLRVVEVLKDKVKFAAVYSGVTLGAVTAKVVKGEVRWEC